MGARRLPIVFCAAVAAVFAWMLVDRFFAYDRVEGIIDRFVDEIALGRRHALEEDIERRRSVLARYAARTDAAEAHRARALWKMRALLADADQNTGTVLPRAPDRLQVALDVCRTALEVDSILIGSQQRQLAEFRQLVSRYDSLVQIHRDEIDLRRRLTDVYRVEARRQRAWRTVALVAGVGAAVTLLVKAP